MKLARNSLIAALLCYVCGAVELASAQTALKYTGKPQPPNSSVSRQAAYQQPLAETVPPGAAEELKPQPMPSGTNIVDPASLIAPQVPMQPPMTDSCDVYFGRGTCCPPQWYLDQGVQLLVRGRPHLVKLGNEFVTVPSPQLIPVIDSRVTAFEPQAGYTMTLGYHLGHDGENRDDYFEFTYWGLNNWHERYDVNGGRLTLGTLTFGDLFSPIAASPNVYDSPIAGFNRADMMAIESESEIHNFEWNLRLVPRNQPDRLVLHPDGRWERETPRGCQWQYLIGVRYISFDESFAFRAQGHFEENGVSLGRTTADYLTFARNDMAGLQAGVEMHWQHARWDAGVRVKAGPFINWAEQSGYSRTTGAGNDPLSNGQDLNFTQHGANSKGAFVGEVGLFSTYRLRKNFQIHAAYDFYWLSGLALAPEQIHYETAPPPGRIANTTTLLFQGISLKAELMW